MGKMIMGSGEDGLRSLSFNRRNQHRHSHNHSAVVSSASSARKEVPKGCLAIKVGDGEEHELQRMVVPVMYLNHPLFSRLLRAAEDVYGFDQKGTMVIPCHVEEFFYVQRSIEREMGLLHHHHRPVGGCFRA